MKPQAWTERDRLRCIALIVNGVTGAGGDPWYALAAIAMVATLTPTTLNTNRTIIAQALGAEIAAFEQFCEEQPHAD